jgi:hypothetical protein
VTAGAKARIRERTYAALKRRSSTVLRVSVGLWSRGGGGGKQIPHFVRNDKILVWVTNLPAAAGVDMAVVCSVDSV